MQSPLPVMRIPAATYRLQFNASFTFEDARRIAGYLEKLGITDVYASPILRARKGSPHGYDVVDAAALNPELGTEEDFDALDAALKSHSLGLLLDIVPNHMAASRENAWWMSVLENGQNSRFLHYFDIDWSPVTAQGKTVTKVLLPILGRPYGEAVESQEITLGFDPDGFYFQYYEHRLPLSPESYRIILRHCLDALPADGVGLEVQELTTGEEAVPNSRFLKETIHRIHGQDAHFREALARAIDHFNGRPGRPETFDDLDALLDEQWYRLAYWRIASEKINYRRFFDVTDLVGVRIENPEVFEARNRRTLELIAQGKVTGLRIDHIDGLYDPIGHMRKLQLRLEEGGESPGPASEADATAGDLSFYVVVEKILAPDEDLPRAFPVSGTTGYDFLDTVNSLFIEPAGLQRLSRFYQSFTGTDRSFEELAYERKKQVINELFSGEMRALGKQLSGLAMLDRNARDFAPVDLLSALTEITASMEVYRTYIRRYEVEEPARVYITRAVRRARDRAPESVDRRIFEFLERVLLVAPPEYAEAHKENWLSFVMRWQQFTGRVMAKGVEDTAFYNYNRLISMNEVGGEPGRTDLDAAEAFHRRNERVAVQWPDTLNATSTHDTKRSEDVRARINVLSEMAEQWEEAVRRWSAANEPLRTAGVPDANVELLVYQTLVGIWPLDATEVASLPERLRLFLEKAAREAKTNTSWISPRPEYEQALQAFSDAVLGNEKFIASFKELHRPIAHYGFLNALAQTVLKITSPGVPDFYQGTELWDFSLVDPDNRRPVDYAKRDEMLEKMRAADERKSLDRGTMLRRWFDGRVKLFTTWRTLEVRRRNAEVFRRGSYTALRQGGDNVCAFLRGDSVLVAVPRLTARLVTPPDLPVGDVWGDRTLETGGRWVNAFTGETVEGDALKLREVFATFPVAVLERG